jgi:hypothetical protein
MTPPNGGCGAGNWLPLIVAVALGEPKVPVTVWASAMLDRLSINATGTKQCIRVNRRVNFISELLLDMVTGTQFYVSFMKLVGQNEAQFTHILDICGLSRLNIKDARQKLLSKATI